MKSARLESSSSPTGESSESGSCEIRRISRTRSGGHADLLGQLVDGRLALELLLHLALGAHHPVHGLDHVHRDADGAGLVGDRAGDRLADPPRGVGGELEALGVVELVDRPHQAEVALLDEVEELHAPAAVALGDADDEAQVGLDQLALGPLAVRRPGGRRRRRSDGVTSGSSSSTDGGVDAGLDAPAPARAPPRREQVDPADLLEVHAHRVDGAADSPRSPIRSARRQARVASRRSVSSQRLGVGRGPAAPAISTVSSPSAMPTDGVSSTVLVDRDASHAAAHRGRRTSTLLAELDVAQHVRDPVGVQHARPRRAPPGATTRASMPSAGGSSLPTSPAIPAGSGRLELAHGSSSSPRSSFRRRATLATASAAILRRPSTSPSIA